MCTVMQCSAKDPTKTPWVSKSRGKSVVATVAMVAIVARDMHPKNRSCQKSQNFGDCRALREATALTLGTLFCPSRFEPRGNGVDSGYTFWPLSF